MIQKQELVAGLVLQLAAAVACSSLARAAELREVQSFGDNPTNTRMFVYVPDQVAAMPPILVAIHYCTGSAQAFFDGTSYRSQADRHGFIVIYPETTASDKCFDVHSEGTLKHDGGGESTAIANMVRYALREYGANVQRVYVTGTSSGAMMTNVMVGAYPELFRAGAAFAGVPFGCFAGPDRWNGNCADGKTTKSAQEWGDLVRAAYPGYMGARPRMQLWHGDRDETLDFHNFGEEIKQWTNVLGVSEMPTSTEQAAPESGWTRTRYADAAGVVRVEAMVGPGMPHNLKVLSDEAVRFFGLDADRDPVPAAGGGGTGGSVGAAGAGAPGSAGMVGVAMNGGAGSGGPGMSGPSAGAVASSGAAGPGAPASGAAGGGTGAQANGTSVAGAAGGWAIGATAAAGGAASAVTAGAAGVAAGAAVAARGLAAAGSGARAAVGGGAGTAAAAGSNTLQSAVDGSAVPSDAGGCSVSVVRRVPSRWTSLLGGLLCLCVARRARRRTAAEMTVGAS
jgi:poly(hydroxyalkanoate) depolymerase family esterase